MAAPGQSGHIGHVAKRSGHLTNGDLAYAEPRFRGEMKGGTASGDEMGPFLKRRGALLRPAGASTVI